MLADAPRDGCPVEYRWHLCKSSVIPLLVPCRKLWLTPTARVSCSNAANLEEYKTWRQSECSWQNAVRGNSPQNVYDSVQAQEKAKHRAKFGSSPLSDVRAVTKPRCETRCNLLGCPKLTNRSQLLVGWRSAYCENIWRRYCCLTSFLPIIDTLLGFEDIARESCAVVHRRRFLANFCIPYFQRAACSTFQTCILNSR